MAAIAPARTTDLGAVLDVVRTATSHMESQGIHQWDEIYPDEATLQRDIEKQHLHVIRVNGEIAGMVTINDEQPPEYKNVQWKYSGKALVVHRLTIAPSRQRLGLATCLMRFAGEMAERRGYDTIRLDAFTKNPGAIALYERLGYEKAWTVQFRKGPFHCFEKPVREK